MLRFAALLAALLALSGCVTYPDITQARSACVYQPGGWCPFISSAAEEAFVYAIVSTNVYKDEDELFAIDGSTLELLERDELPDEAAQTGFDYEIFERYSAPEGQPERRLLERIMAFRGTDPGATDVIYGALREDQRLLAIEYFAKELQNYPDTPRWVVTGHSLGGALATEVSLRNPDMADLRAYAFNVSPFYAYESEGFDAKRMIINERGEIIRNLRKFRPAPAADMYVVSCIPEEGSVEKHSITRLAICLTWIAAYQSEEAAHFMAINADGPESTRITKPPVECGSPVKPHPGIGYVQTQPCLHRARRSPEHSTAD